MAKVTPIGPRTRIGQREAMTPARLRRKRAAGELRGDERAFVHVGRSATRVLTGEDDLSSWTEEELVRGQRKGRNGRWVGKNPEVIPKRLHDELVRRKMSEAYALLNTNLVKAVQVLVDIATSTYSEDSDRIKAAKIIIERVMGKTPEKIQLSVDAPWLQALQAGIVSVQNQNDVIEVDEEEEDD